MRFDGTRVVITGGSSGIGLATARAFLAEGATVAIAGRDARKLADAARTLNSPRLSTHQADVTDDAQVRSLFAAVGEVAVLVNNAGSNIKERSIRELTTERWDALIRSNLNSAYYCIQAALPGMLARKAGTIVNISSTAGKRATPLAGAGYSAAKFGLAALGICLGVEERESGIRVTNIYPGEVDTPILDARPKPPTPEQKAVILQPDDIAAAVLFVAGLPARAHVPELVMKPTAHVYM
ncbi:MAG: SDR family oxidoreductase [Gemmataceae bacterium]|nr:SDR family oxidoreductase [Gemmataceae bacterium]